MRNSYRIILGFKNIKKVFMKRIKSILQHECQTRATRVRLERNECDSNNASAWRVLHEQQQCNKSATRTTQVRYKWKKFPFDNDTTENMFSQPYISYMANERIQGEEQFHSRSYLLEMPCSHVKMRFKSAPQKLNFVMAKAISKSYIIDCSCKCPCTFPHSYA